MMEKKMYVCELSLIDAFAIYAEEHPFEFIDGSNKDAHMREREIAFLSGAAAMYVFLMRAQDIADDAEAVKVMNGLQDQALRRYGELIGCECPDCVAYQAEQKAQRKGAN